MQLIDLGSIPRTGAGFTGVLDDLCQQLELDHASYCVTNTISGAVQGFSNFPTAWVDHYKSNGLHIADPTIDLSTRSIAPVDWSRFRAHRGFQKVFLRGRDFGIPDQGLTVPIRGPYGECGLLSVTRETSARDWTLLRPKIIGSLQMAAVALHDTVMQGDTLAATLRRPALSSREREVLQWAAAGKSQQDIADILTLSLRTVEVHLRSARSKLAALTTTQAAGRAISLGIITPG